MSSQCYRDCKENKAAYTAMRLDSIVDIDEVIDYDDVSFDSSLYWVVQRLSFRFNAPNDQ